MKKDLKRLLSLCVIPLACSASIYAGDVKGLVRDKEAVFSLPGASVRVLGTSMSTTTDLNGNYVLKLRPGTYSIEIRFLGYKPYIIEKLKVGKENITLDADLEINAQVLGSVMVTGRAKKNTEVAAITEQKRSLLVQSGVSAQQISKTQDKDASEVIRRVPGVSLIDEKFVMVRGLSQRYNNVWLNGSAVPSSEADSRSFSFDIIPSSQLDNLTIVKSPAPEYPADFTGGFVLVNTKEMPGENGLNVTLGLGMNDRTHFRNFFYGKSGGTDFLGFDNGMRSLQGGMNAVMNKYEGTENIDVMNNSFNNDWTVRRKKPLPDLKFNFSYNHQWNIENLGKIGMLAALNYSNGYHSYTDMENSLFGAYDVTNDRPVYLRRSVDNQYSNDARLGAMLNLTLRPKGKGHLFEWKNIFNQLGKDRYTERSGFNAQNDREHNMEYFYSSRTTYNTQFTGKHTLKENFLDWSAGYAYANRDMPDRRVINLNDRTDNRMGLYSIDREYTRLDEHIFSANVNYKREFAIASVKPTVKAGAYGEYRTRTYRTRDFYYSWNPTNCVLPEGFQFTEDIAGQLLVPENYGYNKLYMKEEVNKTNDYDGHNTMGAGYLAANIPLGKFNIYAGVRYEYERMELVTNTRSYEDSPLSTFYTYNDLFPSVNMGYRFDEKNQIRLAYGKSVNRPEFRELSPSVYYDFDLASNVVGNSDLKAAYIHNVDLRYEFYPTAGEQVSIAFFYKRFNNPIEWTYTVAGGTDLIYSNKNAKAANNYGIELDIRKKLNFIGLPDFSLSLNASWIYSKVQFDAGSREQDRPMQGQSPYLINTGLFYQNERLKVNAAILYNRIGKRLVGVGRSLGTAGGEDTRNIPNSYEMPRNTIDLSIGKTFGKWEVKANLRDLLAERVEFLQIENVEGANGVYEIQEVTRSYYPGRNYGISLSYNF